MEFLPLATDPGKLQSLINDPYVTDDRQVMQVVNHELLKIKRLERLKAALLTDNSSRKEVESLGLLISQNMVILSSLVLQVDERFKTHFSPWFSLRLGEPQYLPKSTIESDNAVRRTAIESTIPPTSKRELQLTMLPAKSLMANERTFLSWVNIWIALSAFAFHSNRNRTVSLVIAAIGVWASLGIFIRQAKSIMSDSSGFKASVILHAITTVAFFILAVSEI